MEKLSYKKLLIVLGTMVIIIMIAIIVPLFAQKGIKLRWQVN